MLPKDIGTLLGTKLDCRDAWFEINYQSTQMRNLESIRID